MCEADLHPRCGKWIQSLQNFHQFRLLESVFKARKPAELINETRLDAPLVPGNIPGTIFLREWVLPRFVSECNSLMHDKSIRMEAS